MQIRRKTTLFALREEIAELIRANPNGTHTRAAVIGMLHLIVAKHGESKANEVVRDFRLSERYGISTFGTANRESA